MKIQEHPLRFGYALYFFIGNSIKTHEDFMIPILIIWLIYEMSFERDMDWWKLVLVNLFGLLGIPFGLLKYPLILTGIPYIIFGLLINFSRRVKNWLAS